MPRKPKIVAVNRYGAAFGRNLRGASTYVGSGRLFRSYYRLVCLACGWRFAGPRWKRHTQDDCTTIRAEAKQDSTMRAFCRTNLYGEQIT
jgi:ribosomal protein L37AE/L43A